MFVVQTNDDVQKFHELEDAEDYAASKALAKVSDEETGEMLFAYVNGTKISKENVHSYPFSEILRPYGSLKDHSLSKNLLECFHQLSQSWLNTEQFFDCTTPKAFLEAVRKNSFEELEAALKRFEFELLGEKDPTQEAIDKLFS